jgi:hypothetical protein
MLIFSMLIKRNRTSSDQTNKTRKADNTGLRQPQILDSQADRGRGARTNLFKGWIKFKGSKGRAKLFTRLFVTSIASLLITVTSVPSHFLGNSFLGSNFFGKSVSAATSPRIATPPRIDRTIACDLLVAGGGLAGAAAAYESLLAGKTVCLTEITDWIGGQISSQGTSALDERTTQREQRFFPRGYLKFRDRILKFYDKPNPGGCWVSTSCFLPGDGHQVLAEIINEAAQQGNGTLHWLPNTVIKDLSINQQGNFINSVVGIQHRPVPGGLPLNTKPLSQTIEDSYSYENSDQFTKTIILFVPNQPDREGPEQNLEQTGLPKWYVVDATETGELVALTDVPYRLGIDPRSWEEPSSPLDTSFPYCTQGFTYTFAMEATETPQANPIPSFYDRYAPYYSYEAERFADFGLLFTYRRIWHPGWRTAPVVRFGVFGYTAVQPGDISMQNWTWGNDYRPGTAADNLVYSRDQLAGMGQLQPGGWMGGLRTETLFHGELSSLGFFHWLVSGTTDSQLGDGVKTPNPNNRLLAGLDSPMGTVHGLSKYPYMREGRRIIGRPSWGYDQGFAVTEIDISRRTYEDEVYRQSLDEQTQRTLGVALGGWDLLNRLIAPGVSTEIRGRDRSSIFPDAVGIGHYNIDFHPCMVLSPPETPGNYEFPGKRQGESQTYPFQIPLRAMIPQKLDNFLVGGKSIATSQIAAAAYRVHSFEWSVGAATAATVDFALKKGVMPYQLVDDLPQAEPLLAELQQILNQQGNYTAFPDTSILNESWDGWR